jgi:hypothetical protein
MACDGAVCPILSPFSPILWVIHFNQRRRDHSMSERQGVCYNDRYGQDSVCRTAHMTGPHAPRLRSEAMKD